MDEITGDPEALAKEIDGPVGKMPAGQIIGRFVTMDLLVHTWDLARAVGADERLDEDSVRHAYEALKPMDAMIRQPNVFGPKLEPPPARTCRRSSSTSWAVGRRQGAGPARPGRYGRRTAHRLGLLS